MPRLLLFENNIMAKHRDLALHCLGVKMARHGDLALHCLGVKMARHRDLALHCLRRGTGTSPYTVGGEAQGPRPTMFEGEDGEAQGPRPTLFEARHRDSPYKKREIAVENRSNKRSNSTSFLSKHDILIHPYADLAQVQISLLHSVLLHRKLIAK